MEDLYVYALLCKETNKVKIGHSKNPQDRLETVQIHCPGILELAGAIQIKKAKGIVEPLIHKRLKPFKIHNEWFDYTQPKVQEIVNILQSGDVKQLVKYITDYQYCITN